jgi:hypothetical protein
MVTVSRLYLFTSERTSKVLTFRKNLDPYEHASGGALPGKAYRHISHPIPTSSPGVKLDAPHTWHTEGFFLPYACFLFHPLWI